MFQISRRINESTVVETGLVRRISGWFESCVRSTLRTAKVMMVGVGKEGAAGVCGVAVCHRLGLFGTIFVFQLRNGYKRRKQSGKIKVLNGNKDQNSNNICFCFAVCWHFISTACTSTASDGLHGSLSWFILLVQLGGTSYFCFTSLHAEMAAAFQTKASGTQNHKAMLANAYNELGKELSSGKIRVIGNYTLGKVIGEGA